MVRTILLTGLAAVAVGCGAQQAVDQSAERAAILEADEAWSQIHPTSDEFAGFFAADAVVQQGGAPAVRGPDDIRVVLSDQFGAEGSGVEWEASEAEVSACGDLGYSIGNYEETTIDSAGNPVVALGKYVTIWKKQADGSWKVVVDSFSDDGPDAITRISVAAGPDPVEVDPDHYTVEFENDQVRVLRIAYGPGEESTMHYHPDGVGVFFTDTQTKFTAPDGSVEEQENKAGQASWLEEAQHLPQNAGDEPIELILVELKQSS